jgi:hypothetical protein
MESNLTEQEWTWVVKKENPIEFGWIGVDQSGHIGYFSTYGQAYIPNKVLLSYQHYIGLADFVNNLPEIGSSTLCTKQKGWFDDWHLHSKKGLIGYDFQDIHRNIRDRLNQYDLITVPSIFIIFESIPGIEKYHGIIPHFSLDFSEDLLFDDLKNTEIL